MPPSPPPAGRCSWRAPSTSCDGTISTGSTWTGSTRGWSGDGNVFRPEDKENFTALMAELRAALDEEGKAMKRHLLLTFAAGASSEFLEHTEMAKVQASVDFVNLMTYDFRVAECGGRSRAPRQPVPEPDRPAPGLGRPRGPGVPGGGRASGQARPRRALLRSRLERGHHRRARALPAREGARGEDRDRLREPRRRPDRQGRLRARLGRQGAGRVPVERGQEDLHQLRGPRVAAPRSAATSASGSWRAPCSGSTTPTGAASSSAPWPRSS